MIARKPPSRKLFRITRRRLVILMVALAALSVFVIEVVALSRFDSTGSSGATHEPMSPAQRARELKALAEARRAAASSTAAGLEFGPPVILDKPAAGSSGVASSGETPNLELFMERIRAALHPFTKRYTAKNPFKPLLPAGSHCGLRWSSERRGMFLEGCPEPGGCTEFATLDNAKTECAKLGKACGGVTREDDKFQVRRSSVPLISPNDDSSYVKVDDPCDQANRRDANAKPTAKNVWEAFHLVRHRACARRLPN